MNEFGNTIQSSGLASVLGGAFVWIFCHVIYAVITAKTQHKCNKELEEEKALIQHDFDIRLERYRLEYNQLLSEHQTRFDWWHNEMAKSIKDFYFSLSELYQEMNTYNGINKNPKAKQNREMQTILNNKLELIYQLDNSSFVQWLKLRLFLEKEDDLLIGKFFSKENVLAQTFISNQNSCNQADEDKTLQEMLDAMEELKTKFQETLKAPVWIIKKDKGSSIDNRKAQIEEEQKAQ